MLIPIKHENMEARRWPVVTLALIAINVAVFLFTMSSIDDETPQLAEVKNHILIHRRPASRIKVAAGVAASGRRIQTKPSRSMEGRPESLSRRHGCVRCEDQNGGGSIDTAARTGYAEYPICNVVKSLRYRAVRLRSGASHADQLPHRQLYAWRMDAPDRQHVVPLAGWVCAGRRLGTLGVFHLLSGRRRRRTAVLCLVESGEHHSHAGGIGRGGSFDGRVSGALSEDEDRDGVAVVLSPLAV